MKYILIYSSDGITAPDELMNARAKDIFWRLITCSSDTLCNIRVGNFQIIYRVMVMFMESEEVDVTDLILQYDGVNYAIDKYGHMEAYGNVKCIDEDENWLLRKFKLECKLREQNK